MSEIVRESGPECSYDIFELPTLEQYDSDFVAYQQAFAAEMCRQAELGYEPVNVVSHHGRLLGLFRRTQQDPGE